MKADQIIDTIIRYVEQKGIVTDETFLRRRQLLVLFGNSRAKVIYEMIRAGEEVSDNNYITSVLTNIEYNTTGNFSYFNIPNSVNGDYSFIGSEDGCNRFRECSTIAEFQSTLHCQVPYIARYYLENEYLKINQKAVKRVRVNYIPSNPLQVTTWNYELDEYPVDESLIDVICQEMFAAYQSKTSQTPLDVVEDGKETIKT